MAVFAIDGRRRGTAPSNVVVRVDANLFVYTRPIDQINFYERGSFRCGSLTLTNICDVNRNCKLESKNLRFMLVMIIGNQDRLKLLIADNGYS